VCDTSGMIAINNDLFSSKGVDRQQKHHTYQSAKTHDDKYSKFFDKYKQTNELGNKVS